nr:hypothetical protein [Tanacetum cinerariifolium]
MQMQYNQFSQQPNQVGSHPHSDQQSYQLQDEEEEEEDEPVPTSTSKKTKGTRIKKMVKETKEWQAEGSRPRHLWSQGEELLLTECFIQISEDPKVVLETSVISGENDEDWMMRVEILYKTHMGSDFKHKSAWRFLKDKHKWKNPESTLARRNRLRLTNEEPEIFGEDALPRPSRAQRIAKSQPLFALNIKALSSIIRQGNLQQSMTYSQWNHMPIKVLSSCELSVRVGVLPGVLLGQWINFGVN